MTPNPLEELTLPQLRARTSSKWRVHPADVLPLWVAEMDVMLAPTVAEALRKAIDIGDTGYALGAGLAEALAEFASQRWQWHDLAVDRTALVPDVMQGAVETLRLVTDRGDAVVVNPPVYAPFYAFVSHDGRRVIDAPLGTDGRIDLDSLEEAFTRARASSGKVAYLLCNPHNPTGVVHTREELTGIAELARRFGVRVVSDEIHAPLILSGSRFVPYLSVPGAEDAFGLQGMESRRDQGRPGDRRPRGCRRPRQDARGGQPRPESPGCDRARRGISDGRRLAGRPAAGFG